MSGPLADRGVLILEVKPVGSPAPGDPAESRLRLDVAAGYLRYLALRGRRPARLLRLAAGRDALCLNILVVGGVPFLEGRLLYFWPRGQPPAGEAGEWSFFHLQDGRPCCTCLQRKLLPPEADSSPAALLAAAASEGGCLELCVIKQRLEGAEEGRPLSPELGGLWF